MTRLIAVFFWVIIRPHLLMAYQDPPSGKLRVFIDCSFCDFEYFKTEITYVDYVRDVRDAHTHVLVTQLQSGAGGTEFTFTHTGMGDMSDVRGVYQYLSKPGDTTDEIRQGQVKTLALSLVPFLMRLPDAYKLGLQVDYPNTSGLRAEARRNDKWNYWVFNSTLSGFLSGESSSQSLFLSGAISARRITPKWKLDFSLYSSFQKTTFEIDDTSSFVSRTGSHEARTLVVKSLSSHWSAGVRSSAGSSTTLNQDLVIQAGPALEYDFFPYSEATRKQVILLADLSAIHSNYTERTILGKTAETLLNQRLTLAADIKQTWGNLRASLEGSFYLSDFSKNRLGFNGGVDLRVFRGLSLTVFAGYSRVRDQLSLSAGGATPEEVLLRLKQLQTSYRYSLTAGISYNFGSIYSDVVNPRLDGPGFLFQ